MLAEKEELSSVLEGLLFVAGQGVEIKDIAEKLAVDEKDIKEAIDLLKDKHKDDGINIITYKKSVQMCSNPKFAEDIATVLNPIREKQLTKAALETVAIIAYKQPVTRLEIEQVRGVNSDYAMQILQNFNLIEVVGRKDAVGKPLLFGTTDEFLKRFELQSIEDLPDYEELLERIEVLHQEANSSLYRSTEIIAEEDLPDENKYAFKQTPQQNSENKENDDATDKSQMEDKVSGDEKILDDIARKELIEKISIEVDDVLETKDADLL